MHFCPGRHIHVGFDSADIFYFQKVYGLGEYHAQTDPERSKHPAYHESVKKKEVYIYPPEIYGFRMLSLNLFLGLEPDAEVTEALAVRGGSVPDSEVQIREWVSAH